MFASLGGSYVIFYYGFILMVFAALSMIPLSALFGDLICAFSRDRKHVSAPILVFTQQPEYSLPTNTSVILISSMSSLNFLNPMMNLSRKSFLTTLLLNDEYEWDGYSIIIQSEYSIPYANGKSYSYDFYLYGKTG